MKCSMCSCRSSSRDPLCRNLAHGSIRFRSTVGRPDPVRSGMTRSVRFHHRALILLQMWRERVALFVEDLPRILKPWRAASAMTRRFAMRHRNPVIPCSVILHSFHSLHSLPRHWERRCTRSCCGMDQCMCSQPRIRYSCRRADVPPWISPGEEHPVREDASLSVYGRKRLIRVMGWLAQ